ncbi:hypothetical protein QR680_017284 [Steinernema hermaphroditum]|uniref:Uncharacterized protein n=1 Tax=Steinernema hermaphroditum TaxID=289476 RepID=A0AA39HE05_9BILA|nr:hypothetical protein QR680_017284 [Steinernema hermaphroditum]
MVVDGAASGVFRAVIFDMGDVMLRYHDCEDGLRVLSKMKKYPEITPFKKGLNLGHISTEELSVIVKQKVAEEVRTHFDRLTLEDTRHGPDILYLRPYCTPVQDELFFEAISALRRSGFKTALLTTDDAAETRTGREGVLLRVRPRGELRRRRGARHQECSGRGAEGSGTRSPFQMSAGKSKWTIEKVEPLPRVPLLG